MKKTYFDPEMKIRCFMMENVVTASGTEALTSDEAAFNGAAADHQVSLRWNDLGIVF